MQLIGKAEPDEAKPSDWHCPSCTVEFRRMKNDDGSGPPMHTCRGVRGLLVPMVPKGVAATHVIREREDYVNGELVRLDGEGRPTMSVETVRDDGQDATVYAPTVTGRIEAGPSEVKE